jgi:hypothetical protein
MAGEIQLNSTTLATESSGTVTLSNVNSATNRTNLGLGSMATQNANAVALTGGSLTGTEIDLKSSGTTIYASNGTTSVVSESSGTVTVDNATVGNDYTGILEVDQWYLTANVGNGDITTNWARNNFTGFAKIGTGLTESSGVFSFPRTGVYEIISSFIFEEGTGGTDSHANVYTQVSVDNGSTFTSVNVMEGLHLDNIHEVMSTSFYILNVNSISGSNTVKIKFTAGSLISGNYINGSTNQLDSNFTIKRLGPAQ